MSRNHVTFSGVTAGRDVAVTTNAALAQSRPVLMLVFAPWCYFCNELRPTWDQVAAEVAPLGVQVIECDTDAMSATPRGASEAFDHVRDNVNGVPHVSFMHPLDFAPVTYTGSRTHDDMMKFLRDALLKPTATTSHPNASTNAANARNDVRNAWNARNGNATTNATTNASRRPRSSSSSSSSPPPLKKKKAAATTKGSKTASQQKKNKKASAATRR